MKLIHARFLFIQDLVFRKLLTMSSVKFDVNPSDIGAEALVRERFYRLRSILVMATKLSETSSPGAAGTMEMSDKDELQEERMVNRTSRKIDTCEQM